MKEVGCSRRDVQSEMSVIAGRRRLEVLSVCTSSVPPPGIVSEEGLRGEVPPVLQHQVLQLALELPSSKFSWVRLQVGRSPALTRTTALLVVLGLFFLSLALPPLIPAFPPYIPAFIRLPRSQSIPPFIPPFTHQLSIISMSESLNKEILVLILNNVSLLYPSSLLLLL